MSIVQAVPGSFRDPSGKVYRIGDRFFRTVTHEFAPEFEFVNSTGLIDKLVTNDFLLPFNLVDTDILQSAGTKPKYVLEVPKLPFVSFPYEWAFSALKAAALLHLDIHLAALEQGVTLSDSSAYNIQFRGAQPIFIDHLSLRRYRKGEAWVGHRQFCEQFLNPLLLRALFGVPHNAWYRGTQEGITANEMGRFMKWRHILNWNVLMHVVMQSIFQKTAQNNNLGLDKGKLPNTTLPLPSFRRMLERLHKWISKLQPADTGRTIWQNYAKTHNYSSQEAERKRQFVMEFVAQVRPKLLWDLGCNIGEYAKTALEKNAHYVVGFDFDHGALEACFSRAHEEKLALQSLFMDAANPTPNQGWMEQERQGLQARASADGVLALAFVHHLAIARNIPLDQLLTWIVGLAPRGVIEFVPKNDPMVQNLLRLRDDIFPDYTERGFLGHLRSIANIVKKEPVSASGRLLVWYER